MIDEDPAAGRAGTPELTLAELVDIRLRAAGFAPDDPALQQIRAHNAAAAARWTGPRRRTAAQAKAWQR